MKTILKITIICLFCLKSNAQIKLFENHFVFNNLEVKYLTTSSSNPNGNFYVVVKNETNNFNEFNETLKKCLTSKKTLKYDYFYLIISKEFSLDKDKLVLEFINHILGLQKLYESQMNIISDGNYFTLYEETKLKHDTDRFNLIEKRKEIARNKKSNPEFVKKKDTTLSNIIDTSKYTHLNKINSLIILKENESFCDYIK